MAAVISDQVAQAPSTTTPAASETFRLSLADGASVADVIPVDPDPSPPTCDGLRPRGAVWTSRAETMQRTG
jgi:hypothetical protein